MKKETLEKANDLDRRIRNLNSAFEAFYWPFPEDKDPQPREVKLIFEYDDGDGDEQLSVPAQINDGLTATLKKFILEEKAKLEDELEKL